jgi:hypothetical protein
MRKTKILFSFLSMLLLSEETLYGACPRLEPVIYPVEGMLAASLAKLG